jgi:hypothetical protein
MLWNCHAPGLNEVQSLGGAIWLYYLIYIVIKSLHQIFTKVPFQPDLERSIVSTILVQISLTVLLSLPAQWGFLLGQTQFERFIKQNENTKQHVGPWFGHFMGPLIPRFLIGLYPIYECFDGPTGDKYFVTTIIYNEDSPYQTATGFVFRPNMKACPFGQQYQCVKHLNGDWYLFQASGDCEESVYLRR